MLLQSGKFLGIEIGGTKLQLSVANSSGAIEENVRYTINSAGGAANIQAQISEALKRIKAYDDIAAIGVGFGGPVDWRTGTIQVSHQVKGWNNFNLSAWLEQLTKKPAVIENDANVAALAEAVYGCGKGYERMFYITIGSGIGGGMVIDGEIYHGKKPGEVEIGHLQMNKKGITLESVCSGWAVNKKVRAHIKKHPASLLAQMAEKSSAPEATLLKPAIEEKDEAAKKIVEEIADDLSFALSHVVHLFHPDIIVIGGGLSLLKEHLSLPVAKRLPHYIMKAFLPIPMIHIAALGESVVPLGAVELAKKYCINLKKGSPF
jgi:glucokinase